METPQPCNQKQRDVFARMLAQAKEQAQKDLDLEGDEAVRQVGTEMLTKVAEERGATELIAKARKLHKEFEDIDERIEGLGFEYSDDAISLRWNAPQSLRHKLEAAKRSAKREREKSLKKYDLGILGVWAAETADDARKIVEGLL